MEVKKERAMKKKRKMNEKENETMQEMKKKVQMGGIGKEERKNI